MTYKSNNPPVGNPPDNFTVEAIDIWDSIIDPNPQLELADRSEIIKLSRCLETYYSYLDILNDLKNELQNVQLEDRKELILQIKNLNQVVAALGKDSGMTVKMLGITFNDRVRNGLTIIDPPTDDPLVEDSFYK